MSDSSPPIETIKDLEELYKLAKDGDPQSQHRLATIFEDGDKRLARQYYQEAVKQKYAEAEYDLAIMLLIGDGGDKDAPTALRLFHNVLTKGYTLSNDLLYLLEGDTVEFEAQEILRKMFALCKEIEKLDEIEDNNQDN
jgi:TPR repeat protein